MICAACGTENRPGRRFCANCGLALELRCPACDAVNLPGERFCGECGGPLLAPSPAPAGVPAPASVVSERRLVSVLFADLVGFTSLSEHRDPEEVRDLLSEYFERCRRLIERYGGTVEKFIGDAVMAVWGTPVAREDDAERAVRAALALTGAVSALAQELAMPELRVRAGVLTGSAAVEVGAEHEGMVLGDTVNTASRLQSIAAPGTVLVDDVTRRASEAAIEYEDAGRHAVKGRERRIHAWRALRVVAGVGGARRGAGLEAPFVGRTVELQSIIEAGEASAVEGRARLVAVVGEPGSGKSRLLWEYFKYLDGIEEIRWWHQGRCLSYGEGVAYWALAEMIRARAQIADDDRPETAREKLAQAVSEAVSDERERRLVEPRLAHLLRLEERREADRADLFAGWRLYLERLSEQAPVVLAFEDLQWADSGLLDFIDYLLEWSAERPISILALGRPELRTRRPDWHPIELAPLDPAAIMEMLAGLVPELPDELVGEIVHRSEGIPLYAVETIRMLKDRGALVQSGAQYVVSGELPELEVPETLQALVASRLDALAPSERSLLQDVSVLGQSFPVAAAVVVSGRPEAEVVRDLDALVAKQLLGHDEDPRSSERGEYTFLQALMRTVAYGTLSRRGRKARHLTAARHLEQTWPGEARDIAEVLADHYLRAIEAEPEAPDAAVLRESARQRVEAAGRAAARLALGAEADRYFVHAAELASDDGDRAALYEQAGQALARTGDREAAEARLRVAIGLHERSGRPSGGSAALTLAASVLANTDRLVEAIALVEHFLAAEAPERDPVRYAGAQAMLAHWRMFGGHYEEAEVLFGEALVVLEAQRALPELAEAMVRRAVHLMMLRRDEEAAALIRHGLRLSEELDIPSVAWRAAQSLSALLLAQDRFAAALAEADRALAITRERRDQGHEQALLATRLQCLMGLGRWDEAGELLPALLSDTNHITAVWVSPYAAQLGIARDDEALLAKARTAAANHGSYATDLAATAELVAAYELVAAGRPAEALSCLLPILPQRGISVELITEVCWLSAQAALDLDEEAERERLIGYVDGLSPADSTPLRLAARARLLAERAHRTGDAGLAADQEARAETLLREIGARPALAETLLDRHRRRGDTAAFEEAHAILVELGARRRLRELAAGGPAQVVA